MDLFFDEDALAADFGMEPGVAKAPARAPAPPAPWGVDGSKKAPKKKGLKGQITAFGLESCCLRASESGRQGRDTIQSVQALWNEKV